MTMGFLIILNVGVCVIRPYVVTIIINLLFVCELAKKREGRYYS